MPQIPEPEIGVIFPQQKTILRPRGEHTIGLVGPLGNKIVNQHPRIRFRSLEDKWGFPADLQYSINPGHETLGSSLFVTRGAIYLPGMKESAYQFGFLGRF